MPDLWQLVVKHALFPAQARRERSGLPAKLRELERSQWRPAAELAELQRERLCALVAHAATHSPFWRRRLDGLDIRDLAGLRRLPTLSKRDLQEHRIEMRAAVHPGRLIPDKTGGSTGEPVHFDLDSERFHWRRAVALRHDGWSGWQLGEKVGFVWGHRRDLAPGTRLSRLRQRFLDRQLGLDSSTMSAAALEDFRVRLLAYRPPLLVGYANSLYLVAVHLRETAHGRYWRPRAVITSAEYLDPERRRVIESVFECPVFDRYGSRETGLVASECGHGEGLHVAAESILVEILRGDRPAAPGEVGRIVVTDLLNYGLPLIRYEIRDAGAWVAGDCACGRGLPRLRMAGGRVSDFLVTPDGLIVSGTALTIFLVANAPGVRQAQLVQEQRDEVIVRVVPGEGYGDATLAFFARELPRFMGPRMRWRVEPVAEIPLAASGKHQFCISSIDPTAVF